MTTIVNGAVEGQVDEAVLERLLDWIHAKSGTIHRTDGKTRLLERLRGFDDAARHAPWFVLVDLNGDAECAPEFQRRHLPSPSRLMAFRIAVRAIEAWLLADRQRASLWLDVPLARVPERPELEVDPKQTIVGLARRSRSRDVREDFVPRPGSGRKIGPLYTSRLIEFVQSDRRGWRPGVAAKTSDSLARCIRHLRSLARSPRVGGHRVSRR